MRVCTYEQLRRFGDQIKFVTMSKNVSTTQSIDVSASNRIHEDSPSVFQPRRTSADPSDGHRFSAPE